MREFLRKLFSERYGLNGTDELTRFLLQSAIVMLVLSLIIEPLSWLFYGTIIILFLCYFRLFSKNIAKRSRENEVYRKQVKKIKSIFGRNR